MARFEAEDLSESDAAAQAHTYHGSSVLITVELSANIDAVDAWMESRDVPSRHTNPTYIPPNIHAFVKVSLLGALSQQEGIIQVKETIPPWADLPSDQDPSGASGARGDSGGTGAEGPSGDAAGPRLPLWLKGHPYHNLKGELDYLVDSYERGELTEAEAAAQTEDNQGSAVSVIVELINDPANTDAVIAWLKSKGVSSEYVAKHEAPHPHYVGAYVPVSVLGALSRQPGVIRITPPRPPNLPSEKDSGSRPAPQSDVQAQASMPTPTPLPTVVSQGVAAHRAPVWRTAAYGYDGAGVKVGIIDASFDGFSKLMGGDLPLAARVEAQCYTSRMDTLASTVIADCGDNVTGVSHHGTAVAQAVMDIAPEVSLYISNSALYAGDDPARTRLKQDVDWMIAQGVNVINYSIGWGLTEGLGDGAPQEINAVLDTIDTAVASGIIWVNSAGNEHQRRWHGPFTDTNSPRDTYHDYALNDDRNYINNVRVDKPVIVEMRWDDSWKNADCDVDLYLFRDGRSSPVKISIDSQFGRADDKPYEEIKYSPTVAGNYYLRIRKFRCLNASDLSWLQLYVSGPYHLEHFSTGYSIEFPAESKNPGTLAVGAAKWSTPSAIQSYSSRGPTTDGRKKPEIVGADCGKAKFYSEGPPGCWFPGTSQAAPHVAGMAALVKDRFPDYSPEQIAIYLKENAEQRVPPAPDNTDPNNIWGHGFGLLPDPADTASLSPVPSQITKDQPPVTFTLSTNVPASTGVRAAVNYPDDTGNLAVSSLGAVVCPGSSDYRLAVLSGSTVSVKGCTAGTAQVRIYKGRSAQQDTLLQVYTIQVVAPIAPPTNLRLSLVPGHNDRLRANYAQSGPPHNYQFELSRRNYGTGIYSPEITIVDTDGISPVTFEGLNRGYWYKARGRNCSDNTHTVCGTWSSYTLPVELSDPGITISGLVSSMVSGENDQFWVALSDATLGQQYTVTVSRDDDGLGFNASCLQTESRSFTPTISSYNRNFTLYACDTPGGTVTAQLRKDGASGSFIDTATFSVTVTASTNQPPANPNAPTAIADSDKTVSIGAEVRLHGSGYPVNEDNDVTYNWTQVDGTTVSLRASDGTSYIAGPASNVAKFTAPSAAATLVFRLTVTDTSNNLSTSDDVTVTVQ